METQISKRSRLCLIAYPCIETRQAFVFFLVSELCEEATIFVFKESFRYAIQQERRYPINTHTNFRRRCT